jgi:hypothetical protein
MTHPVPQAPVEERARQAVAQARASGTSVEALAAFNEMLVWRDELSAREMTGEAGARLQDELVLLATEALELGVRARRPEPRSANEQLAAIVGALDWIGAITYSSRADKDLERWIAPWLTRVENLAPTFATSLSRGDLSLGDVLDGMQPILHNFTTTAQQVPKLAERFQALWARWEDACQKHPTLLQAAALRSLVRQRRWRYAELSFELEARAAQAGERLETFAEAFFGTVPWPWGPSDEGERQSGRHGYAPTSLATLTRALSSLDLQPDDVFYDLGSGLGLPSMVAALSSGATCRGIEFHAPYVERARENARCLGLTDVTFFQGDASTFDCSEGNKFYMFNPFPEKTLQVVADRLLGLASRKPIHVVCFHSLLPGAFRRIGGEGPVTLYQAGVPTPDPRRHGGRPGRT